MNLYLVQHGHAVDKERDPQRPLSEQGRRETQAMAGALRPLALRLPEVWHSGKTRAVQTAEILAEAVAAGGELVKRDDIFPRDEVESAGDDVEQREGDVMVVGHLPFLGRLASWLLAGDEDAGVIRFRYSGVLCLYRNPNGLWQVTWFITPDLLKGML
ncbi:MAG: phosphohistidine phosphatase SixA [Planctomycetota bacterium]